MKFTFNAEAHEYWYGNRRLPSVTEIIRPLMDYSNIPVGVMEHARQVGQAVHGAIKLHNEDDLAVDALDLGIIPRFEAWLRFVTDTGFTVLGFEQPMYSETYLYAGTPDLWGDDRLGTSYLIDIKATAMIPPWVRIQTIGYKKLVEPLAKKQRMRRAALHLQKDGAYRFEVYPFAQDSDDFMTFQSCLRILQWRQSYVNT